MEITGRIGADGYWYPSVTEILKATESKEEKARLQKWRHKQAAIARKHPALKETETERESKERGTNVHTAIEKFLNGEQPDPDAPEWIYLKKAIPTLRELRQNNAQTEIAVFDYQEKYCGRLDCFKPGKEENSIIDFKSSRRRWLKSWTEKAFLQTAAYALAYQKQARTTIHTLEIHVLSPGQHQCWHEPLEAIAEHWEERLRKFQDLMKEQPKITIRIRDGEQIPTERAYPGFRQTER